MTVVPRFGSSLALNVHFHTLAVDGVWTKNAAGGLAFHPRQSRARDTVKDLGVFESATASSPVGPCRHSGGSGGRDAAVGIDLGVGGALSRADVGGA